MAYRHNEIEDYDLKCDKEGVCLEFLELGHQEDHKEVENNTSNYKAEVAQEHNGSHGDGQSRGVGKLNWILDVSCCTQKRRVVSGRVIEEPQTGTTTG